MARIIIADDDPLVAEVALRALEDAGHAVGWLDNGTDALAAIRRRPPDAVVLDCMMPGMTGTLVLRAMRQSPQLAHVPVIMLTARNGFHDERIAFYEGVTDYLTKPFNPHELVARVEVVLLEQDDSALRADTQSWSRFAI